MAFTEAESAVAPPPPEGRMGKAFGSELFEVQGAPLLPDWTQVMETKSGRNYYVNTRTGETTWARAVAAGLDSNVTPRTATLGRPTAHKQDATTMPSQSFGSNGAASIKSIQTVSLDSSQSSFSTLPTPIEDDFGNERKRTPSDSSSTSSFALEKYASRRFNTHTRGIFRRKIPLMTMTTWTKDAITQPMLDGLDKEDTKEAIAAWKVMQRAMGDRTGTVRGIKTNAASFQPLIDIGLSRPALRDELYVQLCRQLRMNPTLDSQLVGWELMAVYTTYFAPSNDFETYLISVVTTAFEETTENRIRAYADAARKRLKRISRSGPLRRLPTLGEIERAAESPLSPSVFGEALEDIMALERHPPHCSTDTVPIALRFLAESVTKMNGHRAEGIFKRPGDAEMVAELRLRVDKKKLNMEGINDPHVPASLLLTWLRELSEPLIPTELSADAATNGEDAPKCVALVARLSEVHRNVLYFLVRFLQSMGDPANVAHTKMNASSLAAVFTPSFFSATAAGVRTTAEIMRLRQAFVRNLILFLNVEAGHEGELLSSPLL